jgi:hypothetical protein
MDLTANLSQAARRAEAKQRLAAVLDDLGLPADDRRAVLLDLVVLVVDEKPAPRPSAPEPVRHGIRATRGRPRRRGTRSANGGNGEEDGKTAALLELLAQHRGMPIKELATSIYGNAEVNSRDRLRSLLAALKKSGRASNYETGKWEVLTK